MEVFTPSSSSVQPLAAYRTAGRHLDVPAALRRRTVAVLTAAHVAPALLRAGQAGAAPQVSESSDSSSGIILGPTAERLPSALVPVGDLDGDGTRDLLDIRYANNGDDSTTVAYVARRAIDGAPLWTRRLRLAAGEFAFPLPATIGSSGRAGVVLLQDRNQSSANGADTETLTLTGLAGRDGRQLWSTSRTGTLGNDQSSFSGTAVPQFAGLVEGGATTQVVLDVQDFRYSFDEASGSSSASGTSRPMRLDGATGQLSAIGAPLTRDDAVPSVGAEPDATGDGVDDVALLVAGGTPEVSLRRTDGATVWTRTDLPLNDGAYVAPVGQVVGSAAEDLAVLTGTPSDVADGSPFALPRTANAHGDVVLLDGTDGTGGSSGVTGDEVIPLGKAGGARVPAYATVRQDRSSDANSSTVTLTTDARDARGALLWSRALQFTVDDPDADGFGFVYPIGDLDRAGADDLQANILNFGKGGQQERQYRFDGTTGAILRRSGEALFGSLSSHGNDLVTVDAGNGVLVKGRSGRTGAPVWAVRLDRGHRFTGADAFAAPLHSGACNDVVVVASGQATDYAAVLSNQGRLRWSLVGHNGSAGVRTPAVARPSRSLCS